MVLPASGALSLDDIQTEFGGTNPVSLSEYYRGGAIVPAFSGTVGIPTSGAISVSDFYGTRKYPTIATYGYIDGGSRTVSGLSSEEKIAILIGANFSSSENTQIAAPSVTGLTGMTQIVYRSRNSGGDGHVGGVWQIALGTGTSFEFNFTSADVWALAIVTGQQTLTTVASGFTDGDGITINTSSTGFAVALAVNNFGGIGSTITDCDFVVDDNDTCICGIDTVTPGGNVLYDAAGSSIRLTIAASFEY